MVIDKASLTEDTIFTEVSRILEPFNKRGVQVTRGTNFSSDLALDSLAVMDLLAEIEDHFDITVPLNVLPDLEKVGDVSTAVLKIIKG